MAVRDGRLAAAIALVATALVTEAGSDEEGPMRDDAPPGPGRVQALRAAAQVIRPLHAAKAPARPGDWLDQHQEAGQSFDQYRAGDPNRPTGRRTTLYLQPLGDFDPAQEK